VSDFRDTPDGNDDAAVDDEALRNEALRNEALLDGDGEQLGALLEADGVDGQWLRAMCSEQEIRIKLEVVLGLVALERYLGG
jgi:hypothetical protein